MPGGLVRALRDHSSYRMPPKPGANPIDAVRLVAGEMSRSTPGTPQGLRDSHGAHQSLELRRFVPLAGRCFNGERQAVAVSNQVQFCAESAS